VHARINYGQVVKVKEEATACHASQGGMASSSGLMRWAFRLASGKDLFTRAYPEPKGGGKERDLFSGIKVME